MTKRHQLQPVFVDTIPGTLEEGRLYISKRYRTAVHRCCCGCGLEVVTPLNPAKWRLTEHGANVSLFPSVGNWSFPCQSHYWIDHNRVRWAGSMPQWRIDQVRRLDQLTAEPLSNPQPPATPPTPSPLSPMQPDAFRKSRPGWWRSLVRWILGR